METIFLAALVGALLGGHIWRHYMRRPERGGDER